MKHKLVILCLVMLALFCAACSTAHDVRAGVLRDTLFSVEETENGNYRIWLTHDDVAGYCTTDRELGQHAMNLLLEHDGEVLVEFRTITQDDRESSEILFDKSACGSIIVAGYNMHMFLLTAIEAVEAR